MTTFDRWCCLRPRFRHRTCNPSENRLWMSSHGHSAFAKRKVSPFHPCFLENFSMKTWLILGFLGWVARVLLTMGLWRWVAKIRDNPNDRRLEHPCGEKAIWMCGTMIDIGFSHVMPPSIWRFRIFHRATPSHHPFRTMGFSHKPSSDKGYPHGYDGRAKGDGRKFCENWRTSHDQLGLYSSYTSYKGLFIV